MGPEQLAESLVAQKIENERIGVTLTRLNYCTEWQVCQALAQQFGLPCIEKLKPDQVQDELVEELPRIIDGLRDHGYRLVPVSSMLAG